MDRLQQIVGAAGISTDPALCALAGSDILPDEGSAVPEMVIRPQDTAATAACLRELAGSGRAIIPRGAGLSYTGGVVSRERSAVIDTAALTSIHVDAANLVAVVGAGCTWEALAAALKPSGLRPVVEAPISGSHSTVGGAASQGVGGAEGILALAVVLADGSVVRTGSWSTPGAVPFARQYGPDLTGLFIGDCGAFGIKTEVALRLLPPATKRFASFGFETGRAVAETIARLQQGPGGKQLAFDRARAEGASASMDLREAVRTAAAVAGRARSVRELVKAAVGLKRARSDLQESPWSLHLTAEGCSPAHADAQLHEMRALCRGAGGTEIPPAVPQALDAKPFSVRGMVGQDGERWVPVHGHLPLAVAADCLRAIEALLAARAADLREHGIRINWLLGAAGAAITMEPMFYWRDALDPLHLQHLSERNRSRFGGFAPNPAARDYVRALRLAVRDELDRHGATHNQIGRFYRPPSGDMLERIKAAVDPGRQLNPGVLGL